MTTDQAEVVDEITYALEKAATAKGVQLPRLHMAMDDDKAVLLEFRTQDSSIGINVELDASQSGCFVLRVEGDKLVTMGHWSLKEFDASRLIDLFFGLQVA